MKAYFAYSYRTFYPLVCIQVESSYPSPSNSVLFLKFLTKVISDFYAIVKPDQECKKF
jgi:hypothetical protein